MKTLSRLMVIIFGSAQSKRALYQEELQHVDFQLRDGYGENRMKLEKRQIKLRKVLGTTSTQNG